MNLINKKTLVVLCVAIGLTACSSKEIDESLRVADLPEVESEFKPKVEWRKSIGSTGGKFSRIKPVIAYDKVYTASRIGDVATFDQATGKKLWSFDLTDIEDERGFFGNRESALLNGSPEVGANKVFYGSENGILFCLDAQTGEFLWQSSVKGEIIASPAYGENIVVVNTSAGLIKAFNADTGETLWQVEQDVPPLTLRGISTPIISNGGVIVGSSNGMLSVYLTENGQAGWAVEVGEASGSTELERVIDLDSKPVVVFDKIYAISARGNLVAVETRTGRILWQRKYSSYRQITVDSSTIYLTDVKGHVYAVDRLDGEEKWGQLSLTNRQVTGPAVIENHVVVGDFKGYLHWLDKESGELVAQYRLDGSSVYTTPTVKDGLIYAQSEDGDLKVISTPN